VPPSVPVSFHNGGSGAEGGTFRHSVFPDCGDYCRSDRFVLFRIVGTVPASGSSYSFAYASVGEFGAFIVAACLLLEYGLAGSATAIGWSAYLNNFLNAAGWHIPTMLRSPMIVAGANGVEIPSGPD
jgi:hypothetical protein